MISKGCLYHIVRFKDLDSENPPIELLSVVREFLELIPNEFLGIPLEWDIDFYINLLPNNYPISIPPYWIALPN